jgi:hypothetical protein
MTPIERFKALPDKQQQKILDKHRYILTEHEGWWECVYDDFKADMAVIGLDVERMFFSGFSSQGDGACFEGRVDDWSLFLPSVNRNCPALIKLATDAWDFSVKHRGHYYHENSTVFEANLLHPTGNPDKDVWFNGPMYIPYPSEIQIAAWMAILQQYNYSSMEEEFEEVFKGHMRALYRRLEVEYDALTSDEGVLETLYANDMLEEILDELEETHA